MDQKRINKFVVLTTQRSGSNYFCFWLNNHPNIRCHSELFLNKYVGMDGFSYFCRSTMSRKILSTLFCNSIFKKIRADFVLSKMMEEYYDSLLYNPNHSGPITDSESLELRDKYHYQNSPQSDKAVGFKLMYNQLQEYRALENILIKQSCRIIHLIRKNVLRVYLSKITRKKRGIAHSTINVNQIKVLVDPAALLKDIKLLAETTDRMKNKFSKCSYLEIAYEDFTENTVKTSQKIFEFLQVDNTEVRLPLLKKLNVNTSKDIIENYEEVYQALKNTPYMALLD